MDFTEHKSIYLQIVDHLCDKILAGHYAEGCRLPSVRETAAEVEVNANTVLRSYDRMQQQDIIYTQRGLGYFVCEGARETIRQLRRNEFFDRTLPSLVRTLEALDISREELLQHLDR